jgi:hypothetical protein
MSLAQSTYKGLIYVHSAVRGQKDNNRCISSCITNMQILSLAKCNIEVGIAYNVCKSFILLILITL